MLGLPWILSFKSSRFEIYIYALNTRFSEYLGVQLHTELCISCGLNLRSPSSPSLAPPGKDAGPAVTTSAVVLVEGSDTKGGLASSPSTCIQPSQPLALQDTVLRARLKGEGLRLPRLREVWLSLGFECVGNLSSALLHLFHMYRIQAERKWIAV